MDLYALLHDTTRRLERGMVLPEFVVPGDDGSMAFASPRAWPDDAEGRRKAARGVGASPFLRRRRTVAVALACAVAFDERAKVLPVGGATEGVAVLAGARDGKRGIALGWREGGGWRWLRSGDVDDVWNDPLPDLTLPLGDGRTDLIGCLLDGLASKG